jgi:hypothetical protein
MPTMYIAVITNSTIKRLHLRHIHPNNNQPALPIKLTHKLRGYTLKLVNATPAIKVTVLSHSIITSRLDIMYDTITVLSI